IISISKKLEEKLKSEIKSMKKRGESKENRYDITLKILIFGDSSKTAVIQRYLTGFFKESAKKMTIGVDFEVNC
ncbi:unnamed protein product, partial [marine sediment metagenome]